MPDAPSTLLVIFGISGDLSHRYLLPAIAQLQSAGQLPKKFNILGVSRRELKSKEILTTPRLQRLAQALKFELVQMDMESAKDYIYLSRKIKGFNTDQTMFYFAVPPGSVLGIVTQLGQARLNGSKTKLLMEKPFGTDLASAKKLIKGVDRYFSEDQVYRIDHYLAKGMSQNISVFLGGNSLFRQIWNKKHISSIEVVVAEDIGVHGREKFYEQTGALRDVLQNHALQLVALTIAEPCSSVFGFEEVPGRRLRALKSLSLGRNKAIRAQYNSYTKEVDSPTSTTETFAAIEVYSSLKKWRGVPIRVYTGKKLNGKYTEIRVNFKKTSQDQTNRLLIKIQPQEGIELDLLVKAPGYDSKLEMEKLEFDYYKQAQQLPGAYEQVLLEAIRSKQQLFAGSREVLECWRLLRPVLRSWSKSAKGLKKYQPGTSPEVITAEWDR